MRHKIVVLALVLNIAACSDSGVALREGASTFAKDSGSVADAELTGALPDSVVISTSADKLPDNITVPTANLYGVPVVAALQAALYGTDVSLTCDAKTLGTRPVTLMNLKGSLPKVVEKICDTANVSCDYHDGTIQLSEKKAFVATAPALAQIQNNKSQTSQTEGIRKENGAELPEPILIDKDGSRPVSFPKYLQPIALSPHETQATPTDLGTISMKNLSAAPIDNEMIQKDFSRAFGQMSPSSGSSKGDQP